MYGEQQQEQLRCIRRASEDAAGIHERRDLTDERASTAESAMREVTS
jgi:hypothetical protein